MSLNVSDGSDEAVRFYFAGVLKITAISVVPEFSGGVLVVYVASGFFPKLPSADLGV
jgi:hypothetical protein